MRAVRLVSTYRFKTALNVRVTEETEMDGEVPLGMNVGSASYVYVTLDNCLTFLSLRSLIWKTRVRLVLTK